MLIETEMPIPKAKGEITIRDLIKASLRMRPERIIVGEVRGASLRHAPSHEYGHDGSLSTGHTNSSRDMLSRLETMSFKWVFNAARAIRQQIASAIDILIHLGRIRDKSRKVLEISEIVGYKDGQIQLNPLYEFVEEGETKDGRVIGFLKRTDNPMVNTLKFKMAGISYKV